MLAQKILRRKFNSACAHQFRALAKGSPLAIIVHRNAVTTLDAPVAVTDLAASQLPKYIYNSNKLEEFKMMSKPQVLTTIAGLSLILLSSTTFAVEAGHNEGMLIDGTPYQITVPQDWNGVVVNDLDSVTNIDAPLAKYLLEQRYAYTGTGRHPKRMTRHNPLGEFEAQAAVIDIFPQKFGEPERTIQFGCSGGGFVALVMAETYPEKVDGVVALNARGTGYGSCGYVARLTLLSQGGPVRFVDHQFSTPFNLAFYPASPHPF